VDLTTLALVNSSAGGARTRRGLSYVNATLPGGSEVACLNCDSAAFSEWVDDLIVSESHGRCARRNGTAHATHGKWHVGKHPNAPGYDQWEAGEPGVSLAGVRAGSPGGAPACSSGPVGTHYLQDWDLESHMPRLQELWSERRLVVGPGMNPLHKRMDFADVLVRLSRDSPALVPKDCTAELSRRSPKCGALLNNGMVNGASAAELRHALETTFGAQFLRENEFNPSWSEDEQRAHMQALLSAMKHSYRFYRQACLAHEPGDEHCDTKAPSAVLGQIACKPEEDGLPDGCVYADLRSCGACGAGGPRFFEYARLHGPLALFGTRHTRDWVMGQCEEFSRAGHALFASLGYEARYVLDFTDHVWIEVGLRRGDETVWLHADPSEGVLDRPLMYEKGWGKKLTMIFAFTPWDIEHVTARYTEDYAATVARRMIPEGTLDGLLEEARRRLTYELPRHTWGHVSSGRSRDRGLEEIALWSHWEGASI